MSALNIETIFGRSKPVIGMVHLPASPGFPEAPARLDFEAITAWILRDVRSLQNGGVDGLLFCNESDLPYTTRLNAEVGAFVATCIGAVRSQITLPFGVNLLWDPIASIETAAATGASFVREVMCGTFASDMGMLTPDPALIAQTRTRLKADHIALFTNIVPEFATALEGRTVAQRAKAAEYFGFDAILISGPVAGIPFSENDLKDAKLGAPNSPVFANTGVRASTIAQTLTFADGVIAGSSMKVDGKTFNPVDEKRVIELMNEANKSR